MRGEKAVVVFEMTDSENLLAVRPTLIQRLNESATLFPMPCPEQDSLEI